MSAQDLVLKTRFEKQVPYPLLAEIAGAVKESEAKCPKFPEPSYLQLERIWDAFNKLEQAGMEDSYAQSGRGANNVDLRPYALAVIAEAIRFIKILPEVKEPEEDHWVVTTEEHPGGPTTILKEGRYQECLEYYTEHLEGEHAMCLLARQEYNLHFTNHIPETLRNG